MPVSSADKARLIELHADGSEDAMKEAAKLHKSAIGETAPRAKSAPSKSRKKTAK